MLVDYHIHPGYSIDAEPHDIYAYCKRACKIGLKEICFTPHFEVDPERRHLDWFIRINDKYHPMEKTNWLDMYFEDIEYASYKFKDVLNIRAGIEIGYEPGQEEYIKKVLNDYPFDFVLGAVHCLEHTAISSQRESYLYFKNKTAEEVCRDYYDLLNQAVNTDLFDCIAHLDLYRRYGQKFLGNNIKYAHKGYVEPALRNMALKNMALEINTSSIRRGLTQFHPSKSLFELALSAGIKHFTIGSDAHDTNNLGDNILGAINFLKDYDIKPSTYKLRRPIEKTTANKEQKDWTTSPLLP